MGFGSAGETACKRACAAHPECVGFVRLKSNGLCFFKTALSMENCTVQTEQTCACCWNFGKCDSSQCAYQGAAFQLFDTVDLQRCVMYLEFVGENVPTVEQTST